MGLKRNIAVNWRSRIVCSMEIRWIRWLHWEMLPLSMSLLTKLNRMHSVACHLDDFDMDFMVIEHVNCFYCVQLAISVVWMMTTQWQLSVACVMLGYLSLCPSRGVASNRRANLCNSN